MAASSKPMRKAGVLVQESELATTHKGPKLVLEGPRLWIVLGLVIALVSLPWIVLFVDGLYASSTDASSRLQLATKRKGANQAAEPGPAGRVETTAIVISPPLEFVMTLADSRLSTDWRFRNTSLEQLHGFLQQMPLDEPRRREILAGVRPDPANNGLVFSPSDEFIWKLPSEMRGGLYLALALDTENLVQIHAFRFQGTLEEWFASSGVSDETLRLIEKLLYRRNGSIFLADLHVLMPKLAKDEQTRVLKAISGQRTLSVRLRVGPDDNIAELAEYWGRGRRSKDLRPILESLAKVDGTIDVAHLLPAFARMRLYTYPTPSITNNVGLIQNCHWTAFNFFSTTPEDKFTNLEDALKELKDNYYPIYRNPALGDLVIYSDAADPMFHVAVYVADDIVFTKNGNQFSSPWMYMQLDQMKDFYARPLPVEVKYFRHKML